MSVDPKIAATDMVDRIRVRKDEILAEARGRGVPPELIGLGLVIGLKLHETAMSLADDCRCDMEMTEVLRIAFQLGGSMVAMAEGMIDTHGLDHATEIANELVRKNRAKPKR